MAQKQSASVGVPASSRRLPAPEPLGALYLAGLGCLLVVGPVTVATLPLDVWLLIPLLMLAAVPLLWVARAPVLVLILVIALQAFVFAVLDGFRLPDAEFAVIAPLIALGTVTARRPFWVGLLCLLLTWSYTVTAFLLAFPGTDAAWLLQSTTAMSLLAWSLGLLAHANRSRLARLRAEQDRAASAVADERARVAFELNGIISVEVDRMRRGAAAARNAGANDQGRAVDALRSVEAIGVEAMNELRRLLHVLRDDPSFADDEANVHEVAGRRSMLRRLGDLTRGDVAGAGAAVLATVALTMLSMTGEERWLASAYFAATTLVLLWRRLFPVAVLALVIAAHAGAVLLFNEGDFVWDTFTALVPLLVALFAVAAQRSRWISVPVMVVTWAYLAVPGLAYPDVLAQNLATYGLVVVAVWAAGAYSGMRRRQIAELQARRDAVARAIAQERARLAYDLHDVIGHSITIMVVQSAGAARIIDRDPERALAAVAAVERAGAEASAELGHLVEVLSGYSPEAEHRTDRARGLADIGELVDRTRAAVGQINLDINGIARPLEPSVDLAAFCVVREALANAVKHDGPDAVIDVSLNWDADAVSMRVVSSGSGAEPLHAAELSSGYGLLGVRERVRVAGGEIAWAASAGGAFTVTALLPTVGASSARGLRPADGDGGPTGSGTSRRQ